MGSLGRALGLFCSSLTAEVSSSKCEAPFSNLMLPYVPSPYVVWFYLLYGLGWLKRRVSVIPCCKDSRHCKASYLKGTHPQLTAPARTLVVTHSITITASKMVYCAPCVLAIGFGILYALGEVAFSSTWSMLQV